MRPTVSEDGLLACKTEHQQGQGPWSRVTQALLSEWARQAEPRCDFCGVALRQRQRQRDAKEVIFN